MVDGGKENLCRLVLYWTGSAWFKLTCLYIPRKKICKKKMDEREMALDFVEKKFALT